AAVGADLLEGDAPPQLLVPGHAHLAQTPLGVGLQNAVGRTAWRPAAGRRGLGGRHVIDRPLRLLDRTAHGPPRAPDAGVTAPRLTRRQREERPRPGPRTVSCSPPAPGRFRSRIRLHP